MKKLTLMVFLISALCLGACGQSKTASGAEKDLTATDKETVTELQVDNQVVVGNADAEVAKLREPSLEEVSTYELEEVAQTGTVDMGEDMSLFTPEDIVLLDNLSNQDWLFKEDPTWMIRFDDELITIGQENGQVTDVLRYNITSLNHDQQEIILHVIERVNEHLKIDGSKLEVSYYCEVIINGDELTYINKLNSPDQMTETVWMRKK